MKQTLYPTAEQLREKAPPELRALVEVQATLYRERLEAAGFDASAPAVDALAQTLAAEEGRIETLFDCIRSMLTLDSADMEATARLAAECLALLPAVVPVVERLARLEQDPHRREVLSLVLEAARAQARQHAIEMDPVVTPLNPHLN
jgi:hypothetical protein